MTDRNGRMSIHYTVNGKRCAAPDQPFQRPGEWRLHGVEPAPEYQPPRGVWNAGAPGLGKRS